MRAEEARLVGKLPRRVGVSAWPAECLGCQSFGDLERSYDPPPLKRTNVACPGPEEGQLSNQDTAGSSM